MLNMMDLINYNKCKRTEHARWNLATTLHYYGVYKLFELDGSPALQRHELFCVDERLRQVAAHGLHPLALLLRAAGGVPQHAPPHGAGALTRVQRAIDVVVSRRRRPSRRAALAAGAGRRSDLPLQDGALGVDPRQRLLGLGEEALDVVHGRVRREAKEHGRGRRCCCHRRFCVVRGLSTWWSSRRNVLVVGEWQWRDAQRRRYGQVGSWSAKGRDRKRLHSTVVASGNGGVMAEGLGFVGPKRPADLRAK
jgi:hypothetical protein